MHESFISNLVVFIFDKFSSFLELSIIITFYFILAHKFVISFTI